MSITVEKTLGNDWEITVSKNSHIVHRFVDESFGEEKERKEMIVSMGGEAKKNSLVIDTMGSQPLSRGPSTYHRCNSYNVSTQLGPEKGGGRK